jgi:5-methylcytosine-specific restriction protein A
MNTLTVEKAKSVIRELIDIDVDGSIGQTSSRKEITLWFTNFTRSNGPVFSIRPSGLKRHIISLKFGPYSSTTIKHIKSNATKDAYSIAHSLIGKLAKEHELRINDTPYIDDWKVDNDFSIEISTKVDDQQSDDSILESIRTIMTPLITSIAGLIGYEDTEYIDTEGDIEGTTLEVISKRFERSPRNRLICLSIHGDKCFVCGTDPSNNYDSVIGSIIEVHHVEELSEADGPRRYSPLTDLVPLCPNCHRAIHKRKPAYRPNELKDLLTQ